MRFYDTEVKPAFNPMDPSCESEFEVPLPGVQDDQTLGISEGYLTITKYAVSESTPLTQFRAEMESFYRPIFDRIRDLVRKQIADVGKKGHRIKVILRFPAPLIGQTMFLVGGFGTNRYLYEFLSEKFRGQVHVKQPESGYHS